MTDYYKVLNVKLNDSTEQIICAYQEQMTKLDSKIPEHNHYLELLDKAYKILSHTEARKSYDLARKKTFTQNIRTELPKIETETKELKKKYKTTQENKNKRKTLILVSVLILFIGITSLTSFTLISKKFKKDFLSAQEFHNNNSPQRSLLIISEILESPYYFGEKDHLLELKGDNLNAIGEYALAIDTYTKAIEENPEIKNIHFKRAMSYLKMLDNENCLSDFAKEIQLNPKDPKSHFFLAELYRTNLQEYKSALKHYNIALLNNVESLYLAEKGAGICCYYLNDFTKARQHFTKAIDQNSNSSEAYYFRALTLKKLNRIELACHDFKFAQLRGYKISDNELSYCQNTELE